MQFRPNKSFWSKYSFEFRKNAVVIVRTNIIFTDNYFITNLT